MKKAVSRCPAADRAVRYTNCTNITSSTSLVSGSIVELGKDENCYVGAEQAVETKSRASNGNKEEFRFSSEKTGEREDRRQETVSAVKFIKQMH